jgi:hypothetical protein
MKTLTLRLLPVLAGWLLGTSASADTLTLNPLQDAFVTSDNSTNNYGSAGALSVSASGLPKGEFNALLKFDLAGLKTSFDTTFGAGLWAIDSISLRLTSTAPNNPIFNGFQAGPGPSNVNTAGLFAVQWLSDDSWIEGNGTPAANNNVPGAVTFSTLTNYLGGADEALGTFSFNGATSGNSTYNLGLATAFKADTTAGNLVSLLLLPGDSSVAMLFNSQNNGAVGNRPLLSVTASAVPEPGAGALLASGAALGLLRRRRHATPR